LSENREWSEVRADPAAFVLRRSSARRTKPVLRTAIKCLRIRLHDAEAARIRRELTRELTEERGLRGCFLITRMSASE